MSEPSDGERGGVPATVDLDRDVPSGGAAAPASTAPGEAIIPPYRVARAEALATFERRYLSRLIEATGGNASAAARVASMDRPYLLSLLRRHGMR
jgi:DNA-binding NtrC family response regulator